MIIIWAKARSKLFLVAAESPYPITDTASHTKKQSPGLPGKKCLALLKTQDVYMWNEYERHKTMQLKKKKKGYAVEDNRGQQELFGESVVFSKIRSNSVILGWRPTFLKGMRPPFHEAKSVRNGRLDKAAGLRIWFLFFLLILFECRWHTMLH